VKTSTSFQTVLVPITCPTCQREFQPARARTRFCSRACARPKRFADCPTCGTRFQKIRKDHTFCSLACVPRDMKATAKKAWENRERVPRRTSCEKHPEATMYLRPGRVTGECRECRNHRNKAREQANHLFRLLFPDHAP
jgi:hypothetical protein